MEQSSVLSLDSIDRIRFYVKRKYAHLPQEKHAEIVADAIVKIIERQLPDYSLHTKQQITNQLIADVIIPQKRPVSIEDIALMSNAIVSSDEELQLLHAWKMEKGLAHQQNSVFTDLMEAVSVYWTRYKKTLYYGLACSMLIVIVAIYASTISTSNHKELPVERQLVEQAVAPKEILMENELPIAYQYSSISDDKLKSYLDTRGSLLVEEPYYSAIMDTAKDFNIHPILLFAITGQEQGFVDREHKNAVEIANNPFNVFYSWEDYNTTIEDTTAIAARTIVNLSKDRPVDVDPIVWINRKYAEDPNWSTGVKSLFTTMINYIND